MPQNADHILHYARSGAEVVRRGGLGFVGFIVAVLLSPLVVFSVMYFVNDYYHDELESYGLHVIVMVIVASILVPVITLAAGAGRTSRLWWLAGLGISILGWGLIVWFASIFVAPGVRT